MINKIFSIKIGDPQTDRNSLSNIYINTTGPVLAVSFKTIFNLTVATNLIKTFNKAYKSNGYPIAMDKLTQATIRSDQLFEGLCKAIKAGKKNTIQINRNPTSNRVFSNSKDFYNSVAIMHSKRCVTPSSKIGGKTNDAVIQSRTPHPTFCGVLCPLFSVEGKRAGQVSALTIKSQVSDVIYSDKIKELLLSLKDEYKIENSDRIYSDSGKLYSQVILNGRPIGSHFNTLILYKKLLELRRQGEIDRKASIIYEALNDGELNISTQKGRMLRPLIIVYNNFDKFLEGKEPFKQWINYTEEHAELIKQKKINTYDLLSKNIIDYISPIEYRNILVADSYTTFINNKDNPLIRYTHLDVPLSNFCISILNSTFGNKADLNRTVYLGNQNRQTLAIPSFNYGKIFPKKTFISHNYYTPLVETVIDKAFYSGGANLIVGIMCYGDNQEDSIIANENLTLRNKLSVNYVVNYSAELESNQSFNNPIIGETKGIRGSGIYSHMIKGIPKKGSIIHKGMAIIGIIENETGSKSDNKKETRDRSIIYKKSQPIIVDDVILCQNGKGYQMLQVRVHNLRELEAGDKMSARSGGKAIISKVEYNERMPTSDTGICPDIIVNPHAFPSRYIPNQFIESIINLLCATYGIKSEGTMLTDIDEGNLEKLFEKLGIDYSGSHTFYNNINGQEFKCRIAAFPTMYQRLHKMIKDNNNVVDKPNIDIRTQQKQGGINDGGSNRMGEMEKETAIAIGAINSLYHKFFKNCDGRTFYVCNTCYHVAIVSRANPNTKVNRSFTCKECSNTTFSKLNTAYGTFNFIQYLKIIGVGTRIKPAIPEFVSEDI